MKRELLIFSIDSLDIHRLRLTHRRRGISNTLTQKHSASAINTTTTRPVRSLNPPLCRVLSISNTHYYYFRQSPLTNRSNTMKYQTSALIWALAAASTEAFMTKPNFSASRTAAPLKESSLVELPNIEDEVSQVFCRRCNIKSPCETMTLSSL